MSKENAEKFYEALKSDKALVEEMQNALKAQKIETPEQAKQAVIDFAASKGFVFTSAEFDELKKKVGELGDDELDLVSGGFNILALFKVAWELTPAIQSIGENIGKAISGRS